MSIKIIKNAMEEPVTVECENCKSVISYTYDDIQRENRYNLLGWFDRVDRFVVCPVCKANISVDKINEAKGGAECISYDALDGMPMISKKMNGGAE